MALNDVSTKHSIQIFDRGDKQRFLYNEGISLEQ